VRTVVRIVLLVISLSLAVPLASASAKKHRPKPHCAVPKGWAVLRQNSDVVVIWKSDVLVQGNLSVVWRSCLREKGRFGALVQAAFAYTSFVANNAQLAGLYFAYWTTYENGPGTGMASLEVWNLGTRRSATFSNSSPEVDCSNSPSRGGPFLLSPTGVAAWVLDSCYGSYTPPPGTQLAHIFAVNAVGAPPPRYLGQVTTLDSAPEDGELGNLQLYQCAAGCPANGTIAVWTHDGSWRFATVS
jgi:hypothetical protein